MKRNIKNLILLLFLLFSVNSALCYTLTSDELENIVKSEVENQIKSDILNYSTDYKIDVYNIPKTPVVTAESSLPKVEVIAQDNSFKINSYKRVIIKNSKDNIIKSFPINVKVAIFKEVLCAKEQIPFNSEINQENSYMLKKDISKYLDRTIDTPLNSMISSKIYQKDEIILKTQTKQKAVMVKNSTIDIIFLSSKGLKITLEGKALNDGAIGDVILVRSNKYNKTYSATINSAKQATVRI